MVPLKKGSWEISSGTGTQVRGVQAEIGQGGPCCRVLSPCPEAAAHTFLGEALSTGQS